MKKIILFLIFIFLSSSKGQTQYPPISPKWVFEPCVWEDTKNTKAAAISMINGYLSNHIPTGSIIIDSPWELGGDGATNNGYNNFLFDTTYSQPKKFIQDLNDMGIHVILWITGVIDTGCHLWADAKKNGYFVNDGATTRWWRGSKRASHIDFFNPNAVAYWESLMDRVLDSISVDGWKVDQTDYSIRAFGTINTSEGIKTKREYSDAYYSEIYNYTKIKRPNNGMITARPYCEQKNDTAYTSAPISVNTAGWVGDAEHTWAGLLVALNNMFISAHAGYATVGSDIGGFVDNTMPADENLFIRWAQLGALMPIMVNGGKTEGRHFPWLWGPPTDTIYRYFAKLHHQLVPYLFSYDIHAHSTGISIVRPFGSRGYPDTTIWNGDYKYMLGDNLFVAAIYQNDNSRTITFPSGDSWVNYWNEDDIHQGGTPATISYNPNQYPIFIRSGAIIPMNVDDSTAETGHGSSSSKNYLTLLIYPDGISTFDYHSDPSTTTRITSDERCGGFIISFSRNTDSVIIRLKNEIEPERVFLSGNLNLQKKNSFTEFEEPSPGWYHGKLRDGEKVYTWIKFNSPTDSVFVATSSVSDINPTTYKLSKLNVGNEQYIDRGFKLSIIPDEYKGFNMIRTANNDKMTHNLGFQFNVCINADIYIAYDHRLASTTPSWITGSYSPIQGKTITDNYTTPNVYDIWERQVSADTITFGDNNGVSNSSMYFVFYKSYEAPLPVELSAFAAYVNDNNVVLKWETKTEINNYGFEINRNHFPSQNEDWGKRWKKIGFIPGSGNSSSPKFYTFIDNEPAVGKLVYRLKQINNDGSFSNSGEYEVEFSPAKFQLFQNYPNPFNPKTNIKFAIQKPDIVILKVYDILGRELKILLNEYKLPGVYLVEFDGSDFSSGTYFLRLQSGNNSETQKLLLLK
ncbi:MAG: TIM-barrel domain-containing protein [Ignavibacteria bacterium]